MELQGQVAIVTGAGRGIGRATALELARLGADVVVAELDQANAERTATELRALGRRALVVPTDVTSREHLRAMTDQTRAAFGQIDILVNNAGIYRTAPVLDVTEDHWDAIMTINAKGVFFAAQAVLPDMIARKHGVIVNLASMAGKIGSPDSLPYCASKAAVVSMTKSLRAGPCRRRDSGQLRVSWLRGDGHVDVSRPGARRAVGSNRRGVLASRPSEDPPGTHGTR